MFFLLCHCSDLAIREVHQIPKLIMNQFRWLDFLVNGKVYKMDQ